MARVIYLGYFVLETARAVVLLKLTSPLSGGEPLLP